MLTKAPVPFRTFVWTFASSSTCATCAGSAEEGVSARDVARVRGVLLPSSLRPPPLPHRLPRGRVPPRAPPALGAARHARAVRQGEVIM